MTDTNGGRQELGEVAVPKPCFTIRIRREERIICVQANSTGIFSPGSLALL